jgi:transcriptional regulator with XRE-family HTH domain
MAGRQRENLAFGHFGRQVRKERLARGWDLDELSRRTGINAGHLSRIERGVRPPTEAIADAMDSVFPERKGWFREYHQDSREWAPPGFRSWPEYEDKATSLRAWMPGILHGLVQTEDYARAILETSADAAEEITRVRLASRMDRQKRVLGRNDPPQVMFIVDQLSLYREVGSPEVMAGQCAHLASLAASPNIKIQVHPAVAHPAGASEFILTDTAGYAEHVLGGGVYVDEQSTSTLARLFDTLRGECYRVSESLALIREVGEYLWTTGERAASQAQTADRASR